MEKLGVWKDCMQLCLEFPMTYGLTIECIYWGPIKLHICRCGGFIRVFRIDVLYGPTWMSSLTNRVLSNHIFWITK
jgi:hypothetical protein